jgi:O-acetyl-ADP-ribose deacetylase (regulator of RNase III)
VIRVVVDDLAFVSADAVIRPTTANLEPLTPSLRRLEQVGGPSFWNQLAVQEDLAVGSAVVTGAGDLAADLVIHAVICSTDEPVSHQHVRGALISALQRAEDWQIRSLAVPPIGIGAGNLELEDVAQLTVDILGKAMETAKYPEQINIVVENEQDLAIFETYLKRLPR